MVVCLYGKRPWILAEKACRVESKTQKRKLPTEKQESGVEKTVGANLLARRYA
jgi:hypothetical protein